MRTIEKKNNRLFFIKDLKEPGNFAEKIRSNNLQSKFILENSPKLEQLLEEKFNDTYSNSSINSLHTQLLYEFEKIKDELPSGACLFEQINEMNIAELVDLFQNKRDPIIKSFLEKSPNLNKSLNEFGKYQSQLVDELNNILNNPYFFDKIIEQKDNIYLDLKEKAENNKLLDFITDYLKEIKQRPLIYENTIDYNRKFLESSFPDELGTSKNNNAVKIKTIWFNAWKYDKEDVLWRALIMRILDELKTPEKHEKPKYKLISLQTIASIVRYINKTFIHSQFNLNEINDSERFIAAIQDELNPISKFIKDNNKLNENTRKLLEEYDGFGIPSKKLMKNLANDFSLLLKDRDLFDKQRFSEVHFTDETKILLEQKPQKDKDLAKRNRKLLNEAYLEDNLSKKLEDLQNSLYQDVYREEPGNIEFKTGRILGATVKLGLAGYNPLMFPDAIKNFSESIQQRKRIEHVRKIQFKEEFQYRFEEIIQTYFVKRNKRVVIFIDDLDRCLPEKALQILEAIKTFLDVEGCIFVLGIDRRGISEILKKKYEDLTADEYIEKIIQLSFQLPPIEPEDIKHFIYNMEDVDQDFYKPYLDMIVEGTKPNPRKIKRVCNLIELQRRLDEAINPNKKEEYSEEEIEMYNGLMVFWAIISNNHHDFRDEIIKDKSILIQTVFNETMNDLPEEKEKHELITEKTLNLIDSFNRYIEEDKVIIADWKNIPGNENENKKLKAFLDRSFDKVGWIEQEKIEEIDENKTLKIADKKNILTLKFNNEINKLNLEIYKYLFCWGENNRNYVELINYLTSYYKVDWVGQAEIEKIIKNKTLIKSNEKNILTLKLNNEKNKLNLEIYREYLFCWDENNGNYDELKKYLTSKYKVDWIEQAEIEGIDKSKTLKISNDKKLIQIKLNDDETKANLIFDSGSTDEFNVIKENNKINIYNDKITDEFTVNEEKGKISIYNKITDEFTVKEENGKLNIYSPLTKIKQDKLRDILIKVISLGHGEAEKKIEAVREKVEKSEQIVKEIKEAKKEKESLERKNWRGENLEGEDMSGMELNHADLSKANLTRATLRGVKLNDANLTYAILEHSDLTEAELNRAKLTRAKLNSAILNKAKLNDTKLNNAKLWYAQLNEAHLEGAILKDAELYNTSLEGAHLTNANLYNAGLIRATLKGAKFNGAILHHCNLNSAIFDENTDFEGADIDSVTIDNLKGSNWSEANWDDEVEEMIKNKYGP